MPAADSAAGTFLTGLFGEAPPELWVYIWTAPEKVSKWFQVARLDLAARYVEDIATSGQRRDTYVGVALSPVDFGPGSRCTAENAAGLVGLWLDVDHLSPHHQKQNLPATLEECWGLVREAAPLLPTVWVGTGHGLQAWWLFKEPWLFSGAEHEGLERARAMRLAKGWQTRFQEAAAKKGWSVDSTGDLARVFRVPGSWNLKGEPVKVQTLEADWTRRYEPEDLEAYAVEVESPDESRARTSKIEVGKLVLDPDASPPLGKLDCLLEADSRFKATWERKRSDLKDTSASSYDQSLANTAALAGWTIQEIANLLIYNRVKHGDKEKLREDYLQTTIKKGLAYAQQQRATEIIDVVIDKASEEHNPEDNGAAREDAHAKLLKTVSDILGVKITRLVKHYSDDDPIFKLEIEGKTIRLGTATSILDQTVFRAKVAGLAGIVIPLFKARWNSICQAMLKACVEEDIGDEATDRGIGLNWLHDYFGDKPPLKNRDEAAAEKYPFVEDAFIGFFADNLKQWIAVNKGERISGKLLGGILRACGCTPRVTRVLIKGQHTTRNIWWVSRFEFLGDETRSAFAIGEGKKIIT